MKPKIQIWGREKYTETRVRFPLSLFPPLPLCRERESAQIEEGEAASWPLVQVFIQQVFIECLTYARLWPGPEMWT